MQKTDDGKIVVTKDDFNKLYLKLKSFLAKPNAWKIISIVVFVFIFLMPAVMADIRVVDIIKVGFWVVVFWVCGYKSGRERTEDMVKRVEIKIKDHLKYRTLLNTKYSELKSLTDEAVRRWTTSTPSRESDEE